MSTYPNNKVLSIRLSQSPTAQSETEQRDVGGAVRMLGFSHPVVEVDV